MSHVLFENVGKKYTNDLWAVENINLEIQNGEFVSFLGPSGCGKTTTLRMIAGLEENTHGKIMFDQEIAVNHQRVDDVASELGAVGQHMQLVILEHLTHKWLPQHIYIIG